MPEFRERPKRERPKKRPSTVLQPKQAAKVLSEKYRKQLDQRPDGAENETTYATDQVEGAGRWATDEAVSHAPRPRQRRKAPFKEKPRLDHSEPPTDEGQPPAETPADPNAEQPHQKEQRTSQRRDSTPKERTAPAVKERADPAIKEKSPIRQEERTSPKERPVHQKGKAPRQRQDSAPKERTTPTIKERTTPAIKEKTARSKAPDATTQAQTPDAVPQGQTSAMPQAKRTPGKAGTSPSIPSPPATLAAPTAPDGTTRPVRSQRQAAQPRRDPEAPTPPRAEERGRTFRPIRSRADAGNSTQPKGKTKAPGQLRERPRTIIKTRSTIPAKKPAALSVKGKPPLSKVSGAKAAQQKARKQMTQRMVTQAQKAAKATVKLGKKLAEATVKAVTAMVGALVGLLGGGALLVILIFVVIIAAIANSPFGIFFSGGDGAGGRSVPTVSVSEAVAQVNTAYNARLEGLQAGDYDSIDVTGAAADWPDVLAVFASRYAGAEDGVDVATLDADRVDKLTATFWDMTAITTEVETISHPDSDPDDGTDDGWTEYILHITITPKTAEDMKTVYAFTDYQSSAVDELLTDRTALESLAGSLAITNADALEVLRALPVDLSPERQAVVKTALQLVGKVNYFWGGKSSAIGWDSRWGQLTKVTAEGSPSTGTYRPFGLDCTGYVDWTLRNAGLPSDGHWFIGTNLTAVAQADALPGDIALYDDASHVGIVVGRDNSGQLLVCHCSSGSVNNVVVTQFAASGFAVLGKPEIYAD